MTRPPHDPIRGATANLLAHYANQRAEMWSLMKEWRKVDSLPDVLVFEPLGPAGSAKPVSGMRQRPCGWRASPIHMGFDRSAMLLTGLGFESGFMAFRRGGK